MLQKTKPSIEGAVGAARFSWMLLYYILSDACPSEWTEKRLQVRDSLSESIHNNGDWAKMLTLSSQFKDPAGNLHGNLRQVATEKPDICIALGELFARAAVVDKSWHDYYSREILGESKDAAISADLEVSGAPTLARLFRPQLNA